MLARVSSFPPVEDLDAFEVPKVLTNIKSTILNTKFPKQTLNLNRHSKRQLKKQIKFNERILCQKKGRKDQETCEYLRKVYEKYDGNFSEQQLRSLTYITGFKRKQLIKW